MAGVCFVDTETTGLDPDLHEIWEVGLILPTGSEHVWQLPVDLSRADPRALTIGRFHERRNDGMARKLTPPGYFAHEFVTLTNGLHLCGAVVSFDAERLWKLLRANGECPMWHYHLIDVEALAAGCIAGRSQRAPDYRTDPDLSELTLPWSSNSLSHYVGVNPDNFDRHTALGDARWAKAIYEAVMG